MIRQYLETQETLAKIRKEVKKKVKLLHKQKLHRRGGKIQNGYYSKHFRPLKYQVNDMVFRFEDVTKEKIIEEMSEMEDK